MTYKIILAFSFDSFELGEMGFSPAQHGFEHIMFCANGIITHVYIYTCTDMHVHTCTSTCLHLSIYVYIHIPVYPPVYTYLSTCVCILGVRCSPRVSLEYVYTLHICMCTHTCIHIYRYTYSCLYIHMSIPIYLHVYTCGVHVFRIKVLV